jgi:hypothetical protein
MTMPKVPQVRLFVDPDGVTPPYAVIQHPEGYWYGVPGSFKTKLSDEDVKDAIPLQPGPAVLAEVRFSPDEPFGDGSLCDVDINGNPGARSTSVFIAGAFIVSAAVAKEGEPIMVIASEKTAEARPLASVPDRKA